MPCILSGECNLNFYDGFSTLEDMDSKTSSSTKDTVPLLKGSSGTPSGSGSGKRVQVGVVMRKESIPGWVSGKAKTGGFR